MLTELVELVVGPYRHYPGSISIDCGGIFVWSELVRVLGMTLHVGSHAHATPSSTAVRRSAAMTLTTCASIRARASRANPVPRAMAGSGSRYRHRQTRPP